MKFLSQFVLGKTSDKIADVSYMTSSKKKASDFTRNRKMPFGMLILFILNRHTCTTNKALRTHFEKLIGEDITMRQQSVSEARKKLTVAAFEILFRDTTVEPMVEFCTKTWQNYFIYAIDGSKISLPSDNSLREYFGTTGRAKTAPTAQGSMCYDVLNDIVVDALIEPMSLSERVLAKKHIECVNTVAPDKQKLFIFDRGYASFELINQLESEGSHYVMRVRKKFNLEVDNQVEEDGHVVLCKARKTVNVRVIKVLLDSGDTETLITNLMDESLMPKDFKKLYFMRWSVETAYDIVKNKLEIENFTTRTIEGIKQDFYATMYLKNFMASMEIDVAEDVKQAQGDKDNKYEYKINQNEMVGILKDDFIIALSEEMSGKSGKLEKMLKKIPQYLTPIRPKRSIRRNPNPRNSKFHHNRKSNT